MAAPDPRRTFVRRTLGWGAAAPQIESGDVGRDLLLLPRPGSGRLDLACVEGAGNLSQDLAIALTTGRGSDPFNGDFGFDGLTALVEEQEPALVRERLRASVAKTVAADPRVRSVTAIDVDDGRQGAGRAPRTEAEDEALRQTRVTRTLSLRIVVDTIASDAASIMATLGAPPGRDLG
jgi:phage baseplate assembly protein W